MPDNLVRTYEGYGWNPAVIPELDTHLVPTGVWLIDTVQMSALGVITVTARDLGRLLIDQQTNQPVVPSDFDPLEFDSWDDVKIPTPPVQTRVPLKIRDHSGRYGPVRMADGTFIDNIPDPDNYRGHRPTDVLDDNAATFWMSYSHIKPRWVWGVEWIEVELPSSRVVSVETWLVKQGYTVYVSVYADGSWRNAKGLPASGSDPHIPFSYNPAGGRDQQAGIPYHRTVSAPVQYDKGMQHIDLFVPIDAVTRVRLSFANLQHLPGIKPLDDYRVGVRAFRVVAPGTAGFKQVTPGPAGANPGRMQDYTDIIKLACAWAGFYWPSTGYLRRSDGVQNRQRFTRPDPVLATPGRVWGDFEQTGTSAISEIEDVLVNKSLMDVVTYVRNIIGFVFYVDENGAAQWRSPNIYQPGNMISDNTTSAGRTTRIRMIDEKDVLVALDSTVSSHDIKEQIRVKNSTGTGISPGWNPNYVGLRRVLLWNEDRFEDKELKRAAEMIAVRSLFTFRVDRTKIPGFPGIQLDDQVRIMERVTGEGSIHYVQGISSSHDLESGQWYYTLSTHWLGDKPETTWAIPKVSYPASWVRDLATLRERQQMRRPV